jgi:hypothetical protein
VALEQNNTALQFEPGFDPEFERILQRHLKHGGAPVAACGGFDADTASAFLENALSVAARSAYESHLAGCPACRRHAIELSRLMQSVPQREATPTAVPSILAKWKTAIAGWFDVSSWRWNWQTAGLATAAVVVAAVAFRPWQQMSRQELGFNQIPAAAVSISADPSGIGGTGEAVAPPLASPAPTTVAGALLAEQQRELDAMARRDAAKEMSVPKPAGTPLGNQPVALSYSATESRTAFQPTMPSFAPSAPVTAPASPQPVSLERASPPPSTPAELPTELRTVAKATPAESAESLADVSEAKESAQAPSRLGLSSEDNPMRDKKAKSDRGAAKAKPSWYDRAMAFVPGRKGEDQATPIIRDEAEGRFLIRRFHNRVFRFENGVWVDQEYRDDLMKWRVTKLIAGSEEFKQVLAAEPQLKAYFDKAPILVIWRDKIYKVATK